MIKDNLVAGMTREQFKEAMVAVAHEREGDTYITIAEACRKHGLDHITAACYVRNMPTWLFNSLSHKEYVLVTLNLRKGQKKWPRP